MGRSAEKKGIRRPSAEYSSGLQLEDEPQDNNTKRTNGSSEAHTRAPQPSSPAAGFSMGQRPRVSTRAQDDKRGPGAYMSIWEQSRGPAYSFQGKNNPDRKREGPGPGQYSAGSCYQATKSSAPAYSMGVRCGPSALEFSAPGPGSYDLGKCRGSSCSSSVAFTMGCGRSGTNNYSLVPGPGSYTSNLKSSGPSYSMGMKSNTTNFANRHKSPGPGTYDVTRKNSGPSFSIAPRVRQQASQRDSNLGPGTYSSNMADSLNRGVAYTMRERLKSIDRAQPFIC